MTQKKEMKPEVLEQLLPILENMANSLKRTNSHINDPWELINTAFEKIGHAGMMDVGLEEMGKLVKTSKNAMLDFLKKENTQIKHKDPYACDSFNMYERDPEGGDNTRKESIDYDISIRNNKYNDMLSGLIVMDVLNSIERLESRNYLAVYGYLKGKVLQYGKECHRIIMSLDDEKKNTLLHSKKITRGLVLEVVCDTNINSGRGRGIINDVKEAARILKIEV